MRLRTAWVMVIAAASTAWWSPPASAETPEEWIALGTRVHGGFGAFIPLGIRIGLDAVQRLGAMPRELTVVYADGEKSPCPCIADGIMLAATASPGQGTLVIAPAKAPTGMLAVALITHRKSGRTVRYEIPDATGQRLAAWNQSLDARERYDAVMSASDLFGVHEQLTGQAW